MNTADIILPDFTYCAQAFVLRLNDSTSQNFGVCLLLDLLGEGCSKGLKGWI